MTRKDNHDHMLNADEREVPVKDFKDALRQVLLAPLAKRHRSENREPTKAEIEGRWWSVPLISARGPVIPFDLWERYLPRRRLIALWGSLIV